MRKVSKNLRFNVMLVSVLAFTLLPSCERDENPVKPEVPLDLIVAGEEHNQGLEFIVTRLQKISERKGATTSKEVLRTVEVSTKDYLVRRSDLVNSLNREKVLLSTDETFERVNAHYASKLDAVDLYRASLKDLNSAQKSLLATVEDAFTDADLDLGATFDELARIKSEALSQLNEDDRLPVLAAIEVGTNSLNYWHDNFDEWVNIIKPTKSINKSKFNWKKVCLADLAGAIAGAIKGAITGAGAAVTALASGLSASASTAVNEIINS